MDSLEILHVGPHHGWAEAFFWIFEKKMFFIFFFKKGSFLKQFKG